MHRDHCLTQWEFTSISSRRQASFHTRQTTFPRESGHSVEQKLKDEKLSTDLAAQCINTRALTPTHSSTRFSHTLTLCKEAELGQVAEPRVDDVHVGRVEAALEHAHELAGAPVTRRGRSSARKVQRFAKNRACGLRPQGVSKVTRRQRESCSNVSDMTTGLTFVCYCFARKI